MQRLVRTERLVLRLPTLDDAEPVFRAYASDPEVTRYLSWRVHGSVEDTRGFLQTAVHAWESETGHRPWVITQEGRVLGMLGFDVTGPRVMLGYVLSRAAWGQGIMSEAVAAVTELALADPAVWRVWAYCDCENVASARVMEKAGMRLEGVLRRYVVLPNLGERPRDCKVYARVREA